MLKISKIFTSLVEAQENINKNLIKLNKSIEELVKPKLEKIDFDISKYSTISNYVETNIYTKEQTVETINKEYDYRKDYEKCKESNSDLLEMIEQYCKYKDKYEVIQIFNKIDSEYIVDKI